MDDADRDSYEAGRRNIGPAEIALRHNIGWVALAVTILLFAALLRFGVPRWWRLRSLSR